MANLLGLGVARHAKAGFDVREEGLQGSHPRLLVYCSTEAHMWARKSMEFLGLGHQSLRQIAVDEEYRISIPALAAQIAADRADGFRPIAVLGTAGTVSTGAVTTWRDLRNSAGEQDLWFHVDGAFGALLNLSPRYAPMLRGMQQADSLAFDLHKWMYLPFDIGCVLIRDAAAHTAAFSCAGKLPRTVGAWNAGRRNGIQRSRTRTYAQLQGAQIMDVAQDSRSGKLCCAD